MLYTRTGQYQILQVRLVRVPADDACMTVCDTQLVTGTVPVSYLVDQISVLYAKTYQKCGTSRSGGRQILPVVSEMVQWLRRDINKPEARGSNPAVCIPGFFHFPTVMGLARIPNVPLWGVRSGTGLSQPVCFNLFS